MLFGFTPSLSGQAFFGTLILLALAFQVATGLRWVKLGRRHWTLHKWFGVALVAAGAGHGLAGFALAFGWRIGV